MTTGDLGNPHNLFYAAENGDDIAVQAMLKSGFNANSAMQDRTALFAASVNGHSEVVRLLVQHDAEVNVKTWVGETALHMAAQNGHVDTASALVNANAIIEMKDDAGETALLKAAKRRHLDVVEILIDEKANVNAQDKFMKTSLHHVIEHTHAQYDVKENDFNLEDLNLEEEDDVPPPHEYIGTVTFDLTDIEEGNAEESRKCFEIVKLLLETEADVDPKDRYGQTPLHLASERGLFEIVMMLLEAGASIDEKDERGETALIKASYRGKLKVVEFLLDKDAEINAQDELGKSSLHYALEEGHVDVVTTLLEKSADINVKDKAGRVPLLMAADYSQNHSFLKDDYFQFVLQLLSMGAAADISIKETLQKAGKVSKILLERTDGKFGTIELAQSDVRAEVARAYREGCQMSVIILNNDEALPRLNEVFKNQDIHSLVLFNVDLSKVGQLRVVFTMFLMNVGSFEPNRAMTFVRPTIEYIYFIDVDMPASWYVEQSDYIDQVKIVDCTNNNN